MQLLHAMLTPEDQPLDTFSSYMMVLFLGEAIVRKQLHCLLQKHSVGRHVKVQKEALCLQQLPTDVGYTNVTPVRINVDNQGTSHRESKITS